jgi:myosin heavy subunit
LRGFAELLLLDGAAKDYEYLKMSLTQIDGVDDLEEWKTFKVRATCTISITGRG